MNKITALIALFRAGISVSDPALWKQRQVTTTVLGVVILSVVNLLAAFGMSLPVDTETANIIAGGILAVVNVVLTITTTDKIGVGENLTIEVKNNHSEKDNITMFDSTNYN